MKGVSILHSRLKEPKKLIKIRRPPEARLKEHRPCTHPLVSNPTLELLLYELLTESSQVGWDTQISKAGAHCVPISLTSNKAILFYFTQNSVSEI